MGGEEKTKTHPWRPARVVWRCLAAQVNRHTHLHLAGWQGAISPLDSGAADAFCALPSRWGSDPLPRRRANAARSLAAGPIFFVSKRGLLVHNAAA